HRLGVRPDRAGPGRGAPHVHADPALIGARRGPRGRHAVSPAGLCAEPLPPAPGAPEPRAALRCSPRPPAARLTGAAPGPRTRPPRVSALRPPVVKPTCVELKGLVFSRSLPAAGKEAASGGPGPRSGSLGDRPHTRQSLRPLTGTGRRIDGRARRPPRGEGTSGDRAAPGRDRPRPAEGLRRRVEVRRSERGRGRARRSGWGRRRRPPAEPPG